MKTKEKEEARRLRQNGESIVVIAKKLGVSKGSVSLWVRDIPLTIEQIEKLKQNKIIPKCYTRSASSNRLYWQKIKIEHEQIGYIRAKTDHEFRTICALYWGEGRKHHQTCSIANCDMLLLKYFGLWLINNGYKNKIRFKIHYYNDNGITKEEIEKKWLEVLNFLEPYNIQNHPLCTISRASQRKRIGRQPYGTGHLSVYSVRLIAEIFGGIRYLKSVSSAGRAEPLQG